MPDAAVRRGLSAQKEAESDEKRIWIEERLTRTFIANSQSGVWGLLIAIAVVVGMLYSHVPTALLASWVTLIVIATVLRQSAIDQYRSRKMAVAPQPLLEFFRIARWYWIGNAFLWGALVFIYYGKVPLENQFICMLILLGIGAFSMILFSARLDIFQSHIDVCYGMFFTAVLYGYFSNSSNLHDAAILLLIAIFWGLLRIAGSRLHAVQRHGYALQYDNEQLITNLREKTELALYAVKIKDRMLANAAHDLRQPVSALAFYADWLRGEPALASEVIPKILAATDSVNSLFNSLFDFAKIQAGTVQPKFESIAVCQLINDMSVQFNPAATGKRLEFRQRITAAYVWTDALLIRRIVANLLANAIRYTDRGGVLLSTRIRSDRLWIEVWDTGQGIAPEHHTNVFQEFYKASHHQGTEDGFGLGLAIVQRLADVLGHRVSLRSRLGVGTRMRLELLLSDIQSVPK